MAVVEYDGTELFGFQIQPGALTRTVQGELESALLRVTGEKQRIAGAGRTDAGVHAQGQVITFQSAANMTTLALHRALNGVLPEDIAVLSLREVDASVHARHSAKARWYRYTLVNREPSPVLRRRFVHHIKRPLDLEAMQSAAQCFLGRHDFQAFGSAKTTERVIYRFDCTRSSETVTIDLIANAFLKGMVRSIVGTLVRVGLGQLPPAEISKIIENGDKALAGPSVPGRGLCLMAVYYREADANEYV
jgi:tRNA pseudouridine38-40 synthase